MSKRANEDVLTTSLDKMLSKPPFIILYSSIANEWKEQKYLSNKIVIS